jgi:predicted enzyme related to lactoylglutathione lyase
MVEVGFREVVIDCRDPRALARFWCAFTGYAIRTDHEDWVTIGAADGSMIIGFQKVPEPKTVKNRVHLDFWAPDEDAAAREIEDMGATRRWVSEDPDDPFVVLADPEDNEFCIVRGP